MRTQIRPPNYVPADPFVGSDAHDQITVPVPPWLLGRLCQQLDAQGIPYQVEGNTLTTLDVAQPIIDALLPPQPGRRRQPLAVRALGYVVVVGAMAATVYAAGRARDMAAAAGLPGDLVGFGAVLALGWLLVAGLNSVTMRDPRRWLLVAGVWLGIGAALLWFAARGLGVL